MSHRYDSPSIAFLYRTVPVNVRPAMRCGPNERRRLLRRPLLRGDSRTGHPPGRPPASCHLPRESDV